MATITDAVMDEVRKNPWPYASGNGHLNVHWACGVEGNKQRLSRCSASCLPPTCAAHAPLQGTDIAFRLAAVAIGEYTPAEALHRMTDGMLNNSGPPNGPGRPTLTAKWCARFPPEAVKEHVEALRQYLADLIEEELRERQELAPPPQRVDIDLTGEDNTCEPESKRQRGSSPGATSSAALPLEERVVGSTDRRIIWAGASFEPLETWLDATRPSLVSPRICGWVQVHNHAPGSPGYQAPRGDHFDQADYLPGLAKLAALVAAGRSVPPDAIQAGVEHILDTARRHQLTTGKWMLWPLPAVADDVWRKVARATAEGKLGCSAKIGPTQGVAKAPVCCVYVANFDDHAEVRRVLLALLDLGIEIRAGFKPDVYTYLNIMQSNQWDLPPTLFSVRDVKLNRWPAAP